MSITPIGRGSSADAVYSQLLALIQEGEYAVGARIPSELELARLFGVSRPVIREGLGGLRSAGMIESRAGAGTFVTATHPKAPGLVLLDRYETADLHEVRQHLEIPGAGLAALRRTDEHIAALDVLVERSRDERDVVNWIRDDLEFHVTIASATGNALQVQLIRGLRELQFEQSVEMARLAGGLAAPHAEHHAILEAIRAQDRAGAEQAMADHLAAIQQRVSALASHSTSPEQA
ncbi:transcriptional regulator [Mycolicibacterium canariasense]|uniref:Transcriptional regulator n=1 Tax=Mycolicibacterium canariasense TaxID=228230 RepID=A0A100WG75_MYCCR|nr:FadR/GntR family transcriptional regulator [Mycolicibacterium canariasense]MCV7212492.1 FadR family transcriptional regulator [Mycolicibacterium canariasense]GAS97934.1 transcriptional regulator [Mycolicibacterium canariasense]